MDELTFILIAERVNFIASRVSVEIAKLYDLLFIEMVKRSKDYYCNIGQISDPYEKAKLYEQIDYSDLYTMLDEYFLKAKK